MRALKAVKQSALSDTIKQYSSLIDDQQLDSQYHILLCNTCSCRSLLSKVTRFEQDETQNFWSFEDGGEQQQDPLVEKYFNTDTAPTIDHTEPIETVEPPKPSTHHRTESQSSAGLSVGASSLLDSELDLTSGSCDTLLLAEKMANTTINESETILLSVHLPEPEVIEEEGILKMFPKLSFNGITEAEWKNAKQLLFDIQDLQELLREPLQVDGGKIAIELTNRVDVMKRLSELIAKGNELINAKLV